MRSTAPTAIRDLRAGPGSLAFTVELAGRAHRAAVRVPGGTHAPPADAALAAVLLAAMRAGAPLRVQAPLSPRLAAGLPLLQERLREADMRLSPIPVEAEGESVAAAGAGTAVLFDGGVASWRALLDNPEATHLVYVRGRGPDAREPLLAGAARAAGRTPVVLQTDLQALGEGARAAALAAGAQALAGTFATLVVPEELGPWLGPLWSTEALRLRATERARRPDQVARIARHAAAQAALLVCERRPAGNCGACDRCLRTMIALAAAGRLESFAFEAPLDAERIAGARIEGPRAVEAWEDTLAHARAWGLGGPVVAALERALARAAPSRGVRRPRRPVEAPGTGPVAVVVPSYRQPEFLERAVRSALAQDLPAGAVTAIVNDGCPYPETHAIGTALAAAHRDRVLYLRQDNRGVAAARNAGIRAALERWPQVRALFPLDSDNFLSPWTLGHLLGVLEREPAALWASPAMNLTGEDERWWSVPGPHTAYRQLLENQFDTGTLVRREVFEGGCMFDETMLDGYEDWEFFVRAMLAGMRGVGGGECGFFYRRAAGSMLDDAVASHRDVFGQIIARHRPAYEPAALTRREHSELPRWAIVLADAGRVLELAAADLPPRERPLAGFLDDVAASAGGAVEGPLVPGLVLAAGEALLAGLRERGLLAGLLLRLQAAMRRRTAIALTLCVHDDPAGVALRIRDAGADEPAVALALPASELFEEGARAAPGHVLELRLGADHWRPDLRPPLLDPAPLDAGTRQWPRAAAPASTPSVFSRTRHCGAFETTFPWAGERRVVVAASPRLERAADGGAMAHVLATAPHGLVLAPDLLADLGSLTLVGDLAPSECELVSARVLDGAAPACAVEGVA